MPLFIDNEGKLELITEIEFYLERDIQELVEKNLNIIFGLDFVASKYLLNDLRIDTLGYNQESKSFVVVEYKCDKDFSVIFQAYAILNALLSNKEDFISLFNQRASISMKIDDIDWNQCRVIFIAPFYTTYQRKAIELKELSIELWEVNRYAKNIVQFNQILPPEKTYPINAVPQKSGLSEKETNEVTGYTEEMHLQNKSESISTLYYVLREIIITLGKDIVIKPRKVYIAFKRKFIFAYIVPRKQDILIMLNISKGALNDPQKMSKDVYGIGHRGAGDYQVRLKEPKQLDYLLSLIRQSYDSN